MTKFCGPCGQNKPIESFAKNSERRDGLQTRCKACQTAYAKLRYQGSKERFRESNNKRKIRNQIAVYEYLLKKKCEDCGVANPVVLTFDHVRGEKRGTVSDMVKQSLSLATIWDEVAKCEIRCFNCHMIKDSQRRGGKKWNALNALPLNANETAEKSWRELPVSP